MSSPSFSDVSDDIWTAVAGISSARIPAINSAVYYFPQGHLEHSGHQLFSAPQILCKLMSRRFLFSHASDQAFLKFLLLPIVDPRMAVADDASGAEMDEDSDIVTFLKVLTPSDANNGGGFSVPRFCAESIFPPLDFDTDPPVQTLKVRDVVDGNVVWQFRHIYRGTPRRHLLTTGWSKFVNAKRLRAGDSVVFMKRKSSGELFIGIRRGRSGWKEEDRKIEVANNGMGGFEVVYFPRSGVPEFVVSAEKVNKAMATVWCAGMSVKMQVEEFDRTTWCNGVIEDARPMLETGSPWRGLKVKWDEPGLLANSQSVSPWQIECAMPNEDDFHGLSSLRDTLLSDSRVPPYYATNDFTMWLHDVSELMKYENLAYSGMQGARPAPVAPDPWIETVPLEQSFTELLTSGDKPESPLEKPESAPDTEVSTQLQLGCGDLSPNTLINVINMFSGFEASAPTSSGSFQLFGKTIYINMEE